MNLQLEFEKIFSLVEKQFDDIGVEMILRKNDEIAFHTPEKRFCINNKVRLLNIYKDRRDFENQRNDKVVFGYDKLIETLEKTNITNVCISGITSNYDTFIVFTDYAKTHFLGILKSKTTLIEVRDTFLEHKSSVEKSGGKVIYDYEVNENVFKNSILQKGNSH